MQYSNLVWRDGQPYSEKFDDIYYSSNESEHISGENEFYHVFFNNNGLAKRWRKPRDFVIAELGFGSGLNCILTIREWLKQPAGGKQVKCLHYIAIEKYPLSPAAIIELLSRYPELKPYCDEVMDNYPPAIEGIHSRRLFAGRVVIHYRFMDVLKALNDGALNVDAWYLDGFSPAKNPDMWSQLLFEKLAQNSRQGATCSTYTSAGFVKRNLQKAGFNVNKVKGHGNKREMLVAELNNKEKPLLKYSDKPWFKPPNKVDVSTKKAMIIGAGIAGLTLAYALVQRGWEVTIIDKHGDDKKEASSNPAPIVYPRLSINNDVDTEFFTTAYCYALHVFKSLQLKSEQHFWFDDGLLQLIDLKRITRIIEKFKFNSDFLSIVDDFPARSVASRREGQATVNYASAGVVLPAVLCEVLKNECGEKLTITEAEVSNVNYNGNKWQCFSGSELINETETLIIANGVMINDLGLPQKFPVEAIRGQVVVLNENKFSHKITKTLNADVHITPAINRKHYLGATYTRNCGVLEVCSENNRELFESLDKLYPDVFKEDDHYDTWVGFRTTSKDRVPIVGAIPDKPFFKDEYTDICHGKINKSYQPAQYLKGLYISAAHGSRGFTSSFLSAEIVSAQIEGAPMPVRKRVLDYLAPSRFIVNNLKRR